jgi:hypothetical protein
LWSVQLRQSPEISSPGIVAFSGKSWRSGVPGSGSQVPVLGATRVPAPHDVHWGEPATTEHASWVTTQSAIAAGSHVGAGAGAQESASGASAGAERASHERMTRG